MTSNVVPADDDLVERLMREFYVSSSYNPKAARPADNVKAAIAFALSSELARCRNALREIAKKGRTNGYGKAALAHIAVAALNPIGERDD